MATKHVVDTHALIWFLEGNSKLGSGAKAVLEDTRSQLVLPMIVLAETCWIIEKGKSSIPTAKDCLAAIDADPRFGVIPFQRGVLERSLALTAIDEMHDRLIVATALMLQDQGETVQLLTKDPVIERSKLVTVVW